MSFVKQQKWAREGGRNPAASSVRVSSGAGRSARFFVSPDVAEPMGMVKGALFTLLLGAGPDAGRVMIRAAKGNEEAWKAYRYKGASISLTFSLRVLGAIAAPPKTTYCTFKVEDGALIIDLPPVMLAPATAVAAE